MRALEAYPPGTMLHSADMQVARFEDLLALGPITGSVLDIGCGRGEFHGFLRQRGWRGKYTGIDILSWAIAEAQRREPEGAFVCADALEASLDGAEHVVLCCTTSQGFQAIDVPLLMRRAMAWAGRDFRACWNAHHLEMLPWFPDAQPGPNGAFCGFRSLVHEG